MIGASDILRAKILIVDDQEPNVLLLEQMLRGAGYLNVSSTQDPFAVCGLHGEPLPPDPARPPDARHGRFPGGGGA